MILNISFIVIYKMNMHNYFQKSNKKKSRPTQETAPFFYH